MTEENSYDQLPYPSHPFEASNPDHLYSLGRLFGVDTASVENASILELGCASGGNITPLAVQFPNARVVGVDLSEKQIQDGQKWIDKLGLKNIELHALDLREVNQEFGQFDYVICHGVFSWIPDSAQKRVLEICRDLLNPNGLGYISYNCYPGWFMRGMIRQMMLHHVKNLETPKEKVQQARALLKFIVESTEGQETPYAKVLKGELELLGKHPDSYLYHEHLEENNRPLFFYEFVEMLEQHDLQFLGESNFASMVTSNLPPKAAESLTELTTDIHHRSQYTDFVTNRMFRQSIVCKKELKVDRHIDNKRVSNAKFAGYFAVEDKKDRNELSGDVEVSFKCTNGRVLKTKNSALKALLFAFSEAWPGYLSEAELAEKVETKLAPMLVVGDSEQQSIAQIVAVNVMQMLVRGDISFHFAPQRFTCELGEKPRVSELAREQAVSGGLVTTLKHTMLNPDPLTRLLLPLLDGTRTSNDLTEHVSKLAEEGKISVNFKGDKPADSSKIHSAAVAKVLQQLKNNALLL